MLKIFTEASYKRGFGHLARMSCILEKARLMNIEAMLYLDTEGEQNTIIQDENIVITQWLKSGAESTMATAEDVVVVDSYHIDAPRIKRLNQIAKKVVVIDDNNRLDYEDSIVVNPNYYGEYLAYPPGKNNQYHVGKDYTLLREAFVSPRCRSAKPEVDEILISFGGTDINNMTEKVIKAVKKETPEVKLNVVATNAYLQLTEIRSALSPQDSLVLDATSNQMASLMHRVDFAITSAGGTSNELIKSQCPGLIVPVIENQVMNAKLLHENNLLLSSTKLEESDIKLLFEQSTRANLIANMKEKESASSASDFIVSMCL
jgi:UDP-2,4-diacetamido-2,4,6-trideoxy-beta-L-altropyranose hydrolase